MVSSQIQRSAVLVIFEPTEIHLNLRNHCSFDAIFDFFQNFVEVLFIKKITVNNSISRGLAKPRCIFFESPA